MVCEIDFNKSLSHDNEVEDEADSLLSIIGTKIINEENLPHTNNKARINEVEFAYNVLKYLTKGTSAKVTYALHKPFKSMGYVRVIGKTIIFDRPEWFAKIAERASNVEIYSKTDGTVCIDITFHGITSSI